MTEFEGFYSVEEDGEGMESRADELRTALMERAKRLELNGLRSETVQMAVLAVLLVPFVMYLSPQVVGAKDALVVRSGSMEPAIKTGGMVWVYPASASGVSENDVITFRSAPDQFTTHRVIEKESGEEGIRFRTEGDSNEAADPGYVEPDEIYGKVQFSVPYLGYAVNYLNSWRGYMMLVLVPGLLLVAGESREIVEELRRMKEFGRGEEIFNTSLMAAALITGATAGFSFAAMRMGFLASTAVAWVFVASLLVSAGLVLAGMKLSGGEIA